MLSGRNPTVKTKQFYLQLDKMSNFSAEHLLGIKNLLLEDISLIFQVADNFKEVINRPLKKVPSLRDVTVANLFFENSTRTKLSFELAEISFFPIFICKVPLTIVTHNC